MDFDGAVAAQQMMCSMNDRPDQWHENAMGELFRQCWREKYGQREGDYLGWKF
jgi:hypothetical protein